MKLESFRYILLSDDDFEVKWEITKNRITDFERKWKI